MSHWAQVTVRAGLGVEGDAVPPCRAWELSASSGASGAIVPCRTVVRNGVLTTLAIEASVTLSALQGAFGGGGGCVPPLGAGKLPLALRAGGAVVPLSAGNWLLRRHACPAGASEACRALEAVVFAGGVDVGHVRAGRALVLSADGRARRAVEALAAVPVAC